MNAKERISLNKWKADLLIRESKAEDKGLMKGLMISEQKPGQSPGDDRTKEPYDKDWPPPAPLKPRLAGAQDIHTKGRVTGNGGYIDDSDGHLYHWSPSSKSFIDMGPYDPDVHGLQVPLAQNRNGMKVAHAGPGQFYDETGNVTDTHPYKFNRNTTELEVPWLKEQYYDDLPRREQMHEQLDHTSLMMRPEILLANAADVPLGDGMIRQTMNQVQQSNKQKYDLMYQEGFINRQQYIKQMKRTFGKNYEQFLVD